MYEVGNEKAGQEKVLTYPFAPDFDLLKCVFDGTRFHNTNVFQGNRFNIVLFNHKSVAQLPKGGRQNLQYLFDSASVSDLFPKESRAETMCAEAKTGAVKMVQELGMSSRYYHDQEYS